MTPTKIYTGKIFTLKNVWRLPWQNKNTKPVALATSQGGFESGEMLKEDFGDRVIILDERSKRVQVMTVKGKAVWISKYYLNTEIREELDGNVVGELGLVISDLSNVLKNLNKTTVSISNIDKKMNDIIRRVRKVQEKLESEN